MPGRGGRLRLGLARVLGTSVAVQVVPGGVPVGFDRTREAQNFERGDAFMVGGRWKGVMSVRHAPQVLFAVIGLLLAISGFVPAHANLISVNWTEQGTTPTSSLGGVFQSGTTTYGTVSGTTDGVFNAGTVRTVNWGTTAFSAGYSTSVNEGVALAASSLSTRTQVFLFPQGVSSPHLFVNFLDSNTSFDFGGYDWTVLGANNASRSGSQMVTGTGATDTVNDGFLVRINQIFAPGATLSFNYVNNVNELESVRFTVAYVPEPSASVLIALAAAGGGGLLCLRHLRPKRRLEPRSDRCGGQGTGSTVQRQRSCGRTGSGTSVAPGGSTSRFPA